MEWETLRTERSQVQAGHARGISLSGVVSLSCKICKNCIALKSFGCQAKRAVRVHIHVNRRIHRQYNEGPGTNTYQIACLLKLSRAYGCVPQEGSCFPMA
eukprot:9495157-Pyramimonas_sp.AAC.1